MRRTATILSGLLLAAGCAPEVLSTAPGPGMLRAGQVVLVDDGRCAPGLVSRITVGTNMSGGGPDAGRSRACVPRP